MVARALDIPLTPPNLAEFQPITQTKATKMVRIVSQNHSTNTHVVLRKEIDSKFWFTCPMLQCISLPTSNEKMRTYTNGIIHNC